MPEQCICFLFFINFHGGPIGIEMAQAHARLGSKVTVIEMAPTIMGKDDPDLVDIVRQRLVAEGIDLVEGTKVAEVSGTSAGLILTVALLGPLPAWQGIPPGRAGLLNGRLFFYAFSIHFL